MKQLLVVGLGFLALCGCRAATGPLALQDDADRINYSIGYQIGGDFMSQEVELRPEAIVAGIDAAVKGTPPLLDQAQMHETLVALKKRIVAEDKKTLESGAHKPRGEARVFYQQNGARPEVKEFSQGVQYEVLATGTGASPGADDVVEMHLVSKLSNGRLLANTRKLGQPATYPVSKLVPGVQDLVRTMHEGDRWKMYIMPGVAYRGRSVVEDHVVIMEVELLKVLPQAEAAK